MVKKIKVMHIINNLQVGGAEKILVLLANELSKREDLEIYIVSLEGHGTLVNDLSKRVKIKEFKYNLFRRICSRFYPNFRLGLFNYIKKVKPDIIHGHLFKGEDFAKVLGMLTKTPVLTTSHDTLIWPGIKSKFLNRYLTKVVAVSDIVAKHLVKAYLLDKKDIVLIPNAIDTKLFEKGKKEFDIKKPVFLYIGRLLKSKGIDDAIKGLAKLRDEYPQMEFLIYGKEVVMGYRNYLEKIVSKNGWDFVKFMGVTDDVPAALGKGDIFILPSQTEGFAISVLEAAAASKPVIATKVGAIDILVNNDRSGIFVDWHRPNQIYLAAKKLLDNNLVYKYGLEAHQIAKGFDIKKIEEMYYKLYKEVLDV